MTTPALAMVIGSSNVGAFRPSNHKAIHLPTEVLFLILANFLDSSKACKWWQRDLLSRALVWKEWTRALDLLLSDVH